VFLPSPEELLPAPSAETEAEGLIVGFSDSGPRHNAFAVVEVDSGQTLVVPVEKLELASPGASGSAGPPSPTGGS
jgi:hypothetical protein